MWALLSFLSFLSAQARPWTESGEQRLLSAPINVETSKDVLLTFDDIPIYPNSTTPLHTHNLLDFKNFQIINVTSAAAEGSISHKDKNCAVSPPNALRNTPHSYKTVSSFRSNETFCTTNNISNYFDLQSLYVKTFGFTSRGTVIDIIAAEVDNRTVVRMHSLSVVYVKDTWFQEPIYLSFGWRWAPRWGKRVNYVEVSATTRDGGAVGFAIDDLRVGVYDVGYEEERRMPEQEMGQVDAGPPTQFTMYI